MLKRTLHVVGLAVGLSFFVSAPGSAQSSLFLGAGLTMPTGDFGDASNTGWLIHGGFGIPATDEGNAALILEGLYGGNDREGDSGDSNIYGVMGQIELLFAGGEMISPFVFGGLGALGNKVDPVLGDDFTDWQAAIDGGAGFGIDLGGANLYVFGRYVHGFDELTFFNAHAGLSIALGDDGM